MVGVLAGYLAQAAVIAAAIAPAVSYAGAMGGGVVAGRARLVTCAGIALYVGCGLPAYFGGAWIQLTPVAQLPSSGGYQLIAWVIPVASVWLLALTATGLVLALARRRIWALLPAQRRYR